MEKANLHTVKSEFVNAPLIKELPVAVECKLLKFNEDGICIGEIVNVSADEEVLDKDGKIDAKKVNPIIYDSVTHAYWSFGEKVGKAFSDGKKLLGE
jgi:flavin reductase (DIM6/NTAB) family NADH-FMN oxidoreductase RutF